MELLSNFEFYKLAQDRSARIKILAKKRYEADPRGTVSSTDINSFIPICLGKASDVTWLRTLAHYLTSGAFERMRQGEQTFHEHAAEVHSLKAQKKIPFGLRDMVVVKDTGRKGVIADYNIDSGEYIVVCDLYEVKSVPASGLVVPEGMKV